MMNENLKVLLVDDNPDDRSLVIRELKQEFPDLEASENKDINQFKTALSQGNFNFVITDYQLLWSTGIQILHLVKEKYPKCPVIMFTGTGSEEIAVEAMKSGLDDYIIKSPEHFIRLAVAVRSTWERYQERKAREELEQRYKHLFEGVPIGLYRLTPDGDILEMNSTLVNLLGYENKDCLPQNLRVDDYIDNITYSKWLQELKDTGITQGSEVQLHRQDQVLLWVRHSAKAIYDDHGNLLYYEGVIEDITQHKKVENERNDLLIREQKAREEAETANRVKDEFLATLSHELRTPLNSILGWVQIVGKSKTDPEQMDRGLTIIRRNAKMQAQLIDDLLDISRIIRGKLQLQIVSVNLGSVINLALDTVRFSARTKQINLEQEIQAFDIQISGDFDRLQQVLWNLLINAIKFTPEKGTVTVTLTKVEDYAQIKVSDTGIGIEPEFINHIFDRFRQVDSSSKRNYAGLGLGLAIVRYIVEMHGGVVFAQSEGKGKGSHFFVQLPLLTNNNVNNEQCISQNYSTNHQPLPNLNGLKVLLVEDDEDSRELVVLVLEECGAIVTATGGVQEALEAFDRETPEVLISDISMPEKDGYDLMYHLRHRLAEGEEMVKAIALTALAREEDKEKTKNAGFALHLSKPVEPTEIAVAVGSLIGF